MLSTRFNVNYVIYSILGKPNAALKTVLINIDVLYLTLLVVIPRFQNTFLAATIQKLICYLSPLKNLLMNAILLEKRAKRTYFIKPKLLNL